MQNLAIEQLNKEKEEKANYYFIMDCLFNADLMRGELGDAFRSKHFIQNGELLMPTLI
jgi:hypothetical protein